MQSNSANPIYVLGQEYLLEFSELLSQSLTKYLSEKWGDEWFVLCVLPDRVQGNSDINDLSFQMRQILDLNNQNFRSAIAMTFFGNAILEKPHLNALELIRKSRNFWAHPNRPVTLRDLTRLAFNIVAIAPAGSALSNKCKESLGISEKEDHLTKVARLTTFFQTHRDSIEYRSELSRAIKQFRKTFESLDKESEIYSHVIAQNHILSSLMANFLISQPLYYQLLLDQLIEARDPRTGARKVPENQLRELQHDLNTGEALKYAEEYIDSFINEVGVENCNCDFCKVVGVKGFVQFKEESHTAVEELFHKVMVPPEHGLETYGKDKWGTRPPLFLFIAAVCAAQEGIDAETVITQWSFDILNPELLLSDEAYENEDVMETAIKLVALRNGVPQSEVDKWNLYG
jgi:hypothetical protein